MSDPEEQPTADAESTEPESDAADDTATDEGAPSEDADTGKSTGSAEASDGTAPMPEPTAEEPQLLPGGADSIDDPKYGDTPGDPVPRDLDPEDNPAIGEEEVPDEIKEPDDKQQEPDNGESDLDAGQTGESEEPA